MATSRNTIALIRSAAQEEFGKLGFSGARVDRIARKAGVNKQLIFYYFQSKQGLYDAASRNAAAELARIVSQTVDDAGQFRSAFSSVFEALDEAPDLTGLILQISKDESGAPATEALTDAFAQVITKGQALGHYRDHVDPAFFSRHAVSILLGYFALKPGIWAASGYEAQTWLREVTSFLSSHLTW